MKLAYQIATQDVRSAPGVTAWQGDLDEGFQRISEAGYDGAELMVCDPARLDVDQIIDLAQKYHLELPMVCTGEVFGHGGLTFSTLEDDIRGEAIQRAKDAVDLAARLGAQANIGRLRGGYVFGAPPEECRRRSVEGIREVALYAQGKGVLLALEPVNTLALNFINSTCEGAALVKEIDVPSLRLMLDSAHMFIEDINIPASIQEVAPLVSYVHLADSNRLSPGSCKFDFREFLSTLSEVGYQGWLSVEVFQHPDQETSLVKSYGYLHPLIESL